MPGVMLENAEVGTHSAEVAGFFFLFKTKQIFPWNFFFQLEQHFLH